MGALKDVTGAVMPYLILGGLALAAWLNRDRIIAYLAGGLTEIPETIQQNLPVSLGGGGAAPTDPTVSWLADLVKGAGAAVGSLFTGTPAPGEGVSVATWSGLGHLTPAAYIPPAEAPLAALLSPSPAAVALGVSGSPLYGYESVMTELPSTPAPLPGNTYGAFAALDINPNPAGYDIIKDGIGLNLRPYAWNLDRVDASGRFVSNIAAAGGSDPAVWAQLHQYIGMVT